MYSRTNPDQFSLVNFYLPFGGKLNSNNRWVILADKMPWDKIDEHYRESVNHKRGREAFSSRMAFGAMLVKSIENISDERVVEFISENPYVQYFLGMQEFHLSPLFDASMMVHFRKRFSTQFVAQVNEYLVTGKWPDSAGRSVKRDEADSAEEHSAQEKGTSNQECTNPEETENDSTEESNEDCSSKQETGSNSNIEKHPNEGTLLMDATVVPADIAFPTDVKLLNRCREIYEEAIQILWNDIPEHHGHMLPYNAKKARKIYLKLAKSKKYSRRLTESVIEAMLQYVELAAARFQSLCAEIDDPMSLLPSWMRERLQVIPLVYDQQKEMHESGKRTVENRIVSLSQPHVRPINRGKKPVATEFGQKIHLSVVNGYVFLEQASWENFNEGTDLEGTTEEYRRKFGMYPAVILADRIYQTKANKQFCKEKGIRLSGLPLGRRSKDREAELMAEMYQDACERNAVEGAIGVSKRRYGLNRVWSKIADSSITEVSFCILAKNSIKILRDFFAHFFSWHYVAIIFGIHSPLKAAL